MSISLSYMDDLSRVRIELADLPDGAVHVERSLQQTLWDTVRGGQTLAVSGGSAQIDDYEFYPDVTTHYRISPVDPAAGLLLPGTGAEDASTPDSASLDVTGDIDVRALITPDDWAPDDPMILAAKYETSGDQRSWRFGVTTAGRLRFGWSETGASDSTNVDRESTVALPDGQSTLAVRATLDVDDDGDHTVRFFTADRVDAPEEEWEQLGEPVTNSGTTSIFAGTADLQVGNWGGGSRPFAGVIQAVQVYDGIGGTLVASPDFTRHAGGTTGFDDSQGNTWTVQGDAEIVGTWSDSITASLDGEVWLKSVRYPMLNRRITITDYGPVARSPRATTHQIVGRSTPITQHELHTTPSWQLEVATEDLAAAAALDLMLAVGGTMLVHVPDGCQVPGGYVVVGEVSRERGTRSGRSARRYTTVPCTVVTPPGPRVVGTTLTWATVRRLYGDSWAAVAAAHPDWASLLATVGSPDDVVVI